MDFMRAVVAAGVSFGRFRGRSREWRRRVGGSPTVRRRSEAPLLTTVESRRFISLLTAIAGSPLLSGSRRLYAASAAAPTVISKTSRALVIPLASFRIASCLRVFMPPAMAAFRISWVGALRKASSRTTRVISINS